MEINTNESRPARAAFLILILGFAGMLFAVGGAILFFSNQIQAAGASIWPLPALALVDWAIIGILGFFSAFLALRSSFKYWLIAAWIVAGAPLPLIILGAFSIGLDVLFCLPFFLASAILVSVQKRMLWLDCLALFMLGAVGNLAIILIFMMLTGNI